MGFLQFDPEIFHQIQQQANDGARPFLRDTA